MKAKNCLIFGGTGQIGRNLIRKLATNNYKVTVITRNIHTKGNFIKTQANAGYIDLVEANPFNENEIKPFFKKNDICINLIGILFEKGKRNTFTNIHTKGNFIKTQANAGYIDIVEANPFNENEIKPFFEKSYFVK